MTTPYLKLLESRFWDDLDNGYLVDNRYAPHNAPNESHTPLTADEIRTLSLRLLLIEGGITYPFAPTEHPNTPPDVLTRIIDHGLANAGNFHGAAASLLESKMRDTLQHPNLTNGDETRIRQFLIVNAAMK